MGVDSINTDKTERQGAPLSHLYMLVAGVLVGMLIGPAVMGRVVPGVYEQWFMGGVDARQVLNAFDNESQATAALTALGESGVSVEAVEEFLDERNVERAGLIAQLQAAEAEHMRRVWLRLLSLALVVAVVMGVEALMTSASAAARLTTIRYGLMAVLIALLLAQPNVMTGLPWLFVLLVLVVALVAGLVPLGKPRTAGEGE